VNVRQEAKAMPPIEELIFVYNADNDLVAEVFGFAHKILSPRTYACNLCKVSYGVFAMKREWKEFLGSLSQRKVFLYRNEFRKAFADFKEAALPVVLAKSGDRIFVLAPAKQIKAQKDVNGLMELIKGRLAACRG
jgi:hypothetical protein